MRRPNTLAVIEVLKLCAIGKPKHFSFISSTSVLDTEKYVSKSEESLKSGGAGILESDSLEDSKKGLGTGQQIS